MTRRWGAAAVALLALAAAPAYAHGFGQRFDLPLPLYLWIWGAGLTIVLSFVVMAVFVRERHAQFDYPRFNLLRLAPFRLVARPVAVATLRAFVAFVFLLTIAAGYFGTQEPFMNLIVPMIWVVWWVGFAFTCALVGNLWALVNPLRTIFDALATLLARGKP